MSPSGRGSEAKAALLAALLASAGTPDLELGNRAEAVELVSKSYEQLVQGWHGGSAEEKERNFEADRKRVTDFFTRMGRPELASFWLSIEFTESHGDPNSTGAPGIHGKWQVLQLNEADGRRLATDDDYCLKRSVEEMLNYLNLEFQTGFPKKSKPVRQFEELVGDNLMVALFRYNNKAAALPRLAQLFGIKFSGKELRDATLSDLMKIADEGVVENGVHQNVWGKSREHPRGSTLVTYVPPIMAHEKVLRESLGSGYGLADNRMDVPVRVQGKSLSGDAYPPLVWDPVDTREEPWKTLPDDIRQIIGWWGGGEMGGIRGVADFDAMGIPIMDADIVSKARWKVMPPWFYPDYNPNFSVEGIQDEEYKKKIVDWQKSIIKSVNRIKGDPALQAKIKAIIDSGKDISPPHFKDEKNPIITPGGSVAPEVSPVDGTPLVPLNKLPRLPGGGTSGRASPPLSRQQVPARPPTIRRRR